jgi:type IV secretion system protein VirB4
MAALTLEIPDWIPGWLQYIAAPDPEKYIPYAGHIRPNVEKLYDRSVLAMLRLHGRPFELAPHEERNNRKEQVNTLLRQCADPSVTVCFHLVRHDAVPPPPQRLAPEGFPRELATAYEKHALSNMMQNDWFISPVVRAPFLQRKRSFLPRFGDDRKKLAHTDPAQLQQLEDVVRLIAATLNEYGVHRLGMRSVETPIDGLSLEVDEMATTLHLIRTAQLIDIPDTTGTTAAAIYTEPPIFGPTAFDLGPSYRHRYGAMLGFLNYPGQARVGQYSSLLSAPYPLVMTHSFRFMSASLVARAFGLLKRQMRTAGDQAKDLETGIGEALNKTASLHSTIGHHHFSLAVYAADPAELDANVSDASKRMTELGAASITREQNRPLNGAMMQTYFLQMPGSNLFKPRPGDISTDDLACMACLDNYPAGSSTGYWGPSQIRLRTSGATAFDWVSHDQDVGHILWIGPNGRGKSAGAGLFMTLLADSVGPGGIRLIIDKDDSNKLTVEANEGQHRRLRRNEPSGMAPLLLPDSPRRRAFLHRLYVWLIERDGKGGIPSEDDERMMRGIARQMKMAPEKRSMGGVRELLGYSSSEKSAGTRFERYCRGGSMGWLLDNSQHLINLGPGLFAYDFTDILPKEGQADDGACETAAAVITHQLSDFMDGRQIACFFDEVKFYLGPLKALIDDWTITGRKKELVCWLAAQQPEHFTDSPIGMSLVAQARTKIIFPDANYDADNLRKIKLSEPAIRQLRGPMTLGNARRFLFWRQGEETICEFDLSSMPLLPILSGRPGTISLMDRVRAEKAGAPQQEIIEEFVSRLQHANQRRAA